MTLFNLVKFAVLVSVFASIGCGRKMKAQKQEGVSRFEVMTCETAEHRKFQQDNVTKNVLHERIVSVGRRVMVSPDGLSETSSGNAQSVEFVFSMTNGHSIDRLIKETRDAYKVSKASKRVNIANGEVSEEGVSEVTAPGRSEKTTFVRLIKKDGSVSSGGDTTVTTIENGAKVETTTLDKPIVIKESGVDVTIAQSKTVCRTTVQ